MITTESSATLLTFCLLVLLFIGVVIFAWGRKLPGRGSWLVWAGLLLLATAVGFDTGFFLKEDFRIKIWQVGWIWPREDMSAITVGVFQDPLSLAMTILTTFVAAIVLMMQSELAKEPRPERVQAAIAISTVGVALAWISLTPWLVFVGIILSIIGGFVTYGSRWDSTLEAGIAARFVLERSSGFLLSFFGACILANSRTPLLFNHAEMWSTQGDLSVSTWVGAILLVVGLFIQMQPFPFMGWLVSSSEICSPLRTLLNQIFPTWAAFSIIIRLEPQLVSLGFFPHFGWVALGSTFLMILSGLFQNQWRQSLGMWLAAGFSLSFALLAFSGPLVAMGMLLGVSLGALCLSGSANALEGDGPQTPASIQRASWVKVASFLGTAAGTGVIGFVSATSGVLWITQAVHAAGATVAIFLFIFFIYVLLGWRIAWRVFKLNTSSDTSWLTVLALFLCVLVALGFVWTGSLTGNVVLGISDQVMSSGFEKFFGIKMGEIQLSQDYLTASGLYWGALILAFMTAYWTSGRKEDRWAVLAHALPKSSRFIAQGYGSDGVAQKVVFGVKRSGQFAEKIVDQEIWMKWLPLGLSHGLKTLSQWMSRIDKGLFVGIGSGLRKTVDVPAKILQLIQTGDVRWYLFFALSSGFALLSHYLRK
jgi:hypothetical protein